MERGERTRERTGQENAWKCIPGSKGASRMKPRDEETKRKTRERQRESRIGERRRNDGRNREQGVEDITRIEKDDTSLSPRNYTPILPN